MSDETFHLLGIIAFFVVLIGLVCWCNNEDSKECAAKGGHIVSVYKSSLCVSRDGRIIE